MGRVWGSKEVGLDLIPQSLIPALIETRLERREQQPCPNHSPLLLYYFLFIFLFKTKAKQLRYSRACPAGATGASGTFVQPGMQLWERRDMEEGSKIPS